MRSVALLPLISEFDEEEFEEEEFEEEFEKLPQGATHGRIVALRQNTVVRR
jgi:hypothetical protein